jgi:predicted transposase/invertase (TIGR01784 family)
MFDNICKFLAETFPLDFATWLLGEPISLTELKPTELSLEPIRADSLILLQSEEIVLHLEFQTRPDPTIPFRMLDYRIRVYRKFPDKQMRQIVIYLLPTSLEMVYQTTFDIPNTQHQFEVIRLWEQAPEVFQQSVGLLPLAILGKTINKEMLLRQVSQKIAEIEDRRQKNNVAASTAVLAGLVLEQELVKRILRSDIMRESPIYQDILAEGRAEGKAEGKAEARAEAEARVRQIAQNMLRSGISLELTAQLTGLTIEQVQQLPREVS